MKVQLLAMLEMQEAMNSRVNVNWREQGNEWYRAIWVECAELMDHFGWKWWKKQDPDYDQVSLELIDIWHFGLSILLQNNDDLNSIAQDVALALSSSSSSSSSSPSSDSFKEDIEVFVLNTLKSKNFDIQGFGLLMSGIDMSFDSLYSGYVGKNVLNFFRQDHGYKDGSYIKVWDKKEDNEHLVEVLSAINPSSETLKDDIYRALSERYPNT